MPIQKAVRTGKPKTLGAVHANVGIRVTYNRRLVVEIAAMAEAVKRALAKVWRTNPPELAEDASPAAELRDVLRKLRDEWQQRFNEFGAKAGKRFATESAEHADRSLAAQLRKVGMTVKFRMTRTANDVVQASITENVSLIRSIPERYFTQIEAIVTEGVRVGRDMHAISQGLEKQLGVTKRRAAIIARDQVNKATAAVVRVRQQEIGATEAIWLHSGGGRHPRPTHVKMSGKRYPIVKGMWDAAEKKFIWPGELINCRCVSRTIVPGLE